MSRVSRYEHRFVDSFPKPLEVGVLYISVRFRTAAHLCACGCGNKVVTPFSPAGWSMMFDGDVVTLNPSVGNGRLPCQSHYFINRNRVKWSYAMTDELSSEAQEHDANSRAHYYRKQQNTGYSRPASLSLSPPDVRSADFPWRNWLRRWLG